MIPLVRVDNRLIHGQVVEAWLPDLKVRRVAVADDEAANSPLIRAAMGLAITDTTEVMILPLEQVDFPAISQDATRTLVLLRDVSTVMAAQQRGLVVRHLNLGNVHYATGRKQVSPSVFLSGEEITALLQLAAAGTEVEARAVPGDRPIPLSEIIERFKKGSGAAT